jgi:hypothetical protein
MSMTVTRRKDSRTKKVFMHKIADVRGGVSVNVSELTQDYLPEGSILSEPVSGVCHVVKTAVLQADATNSDTSYKVLKGHNFKVGDVIMLATSAKAYAITGITTTNSAYDTLTVGTTLGLAASAGAFLMEAAEAGASGSAFKYTPFALSGTGKPVEANKNMDMDAWLIGVTKGNPLPSAVASILKGIINY